MIRAIVIFAVVIVVISEVRAQESCGFGFMPRQCSAEECCTGMFLMRSCSPKGKEGMACGSCGCITGLDCQNGRCVNPDVTTPEPSTVSPDSASTDMPTTDMPTTDMPTGMPTNEGN